MDPVPYSSAQQGSQQSFHFTTLLVSFSCVSFEVASCTRCAPAREMEHAVLQRIRYAAAAASSTEGSQAIEGCVANLQFPEGAASVREGSACLKRALIKLGSAGLGGGRISESSGWLNQVAIGEATERSGVSSDANKTTAKDLRRFRNQLKAVCTDLTARQAEFRSRTSAIDTFLAESTGQPQRQPAVPRGQFAIMVGDDDEAEEDDLSFLTMLEAAEVDHHAHAHATSSIMDLTSEDPTDPSGGGAGGASRPQGGTGSITPPGRLVDALVSIRSLHADMLSEIKGLRFALSRLADTAGKAADGMVAAAAMTLDRPLLQLSTISGKFKCE